MPVLDDLDRRIIALLERDGRMANVEMARELDVSEATVRKRLERLLAGSIIRVKAVASPTMLSSVQRVLIGIQVDLPLIEQVAAQLAEIPEVSAVSVVTGGYDILIEAVLRPEDGLLAFLMDRLGRTPGVIRTETYQVLKTVKWAGDWAVPTSFASGERS